MECVRSRKRGKYRLIWSLLVLLLLLSRSERHRCRCAKVYLEPSDADRGKDVEEVRRKIGMWEGFFWVFKCERRGWLGAHTLEGLACELVCFGRSASRGGSFDLTLTTQEVYLDDDTSSLMSSRRGFHVLMDGIQAGSSWKQRRCARGSSKPAWWTSVDLFT